MDDIDRDKRIDALLRIFDKEITEEMNRPANHEVENLEAVATGVPKYGG